MSIEQFNIAITNHQPIHLIKNETIHSNEINDQIVKMCIDYRKRVGYYTDEDYQKRIAKTSLLKTVKP